MTSSVPNLHNTNILNISGTRWDMTKRKTPFFFTFKGLSNSPIFQYLNFSFHRHFKVIRCIKAVMLFFSFEVRPEVRLSGSHQPVTEGDNVTLTCNITDGVPKPEHIRWLRAKFPLDGKNTNLLLRSIKKDQEGTYSCETSNEGGSASASIEVIVNSKTSKFDWYALNVAIKENLIHLPLKYTF